MNMTTTGFTIWLTGLSGAGKSTLSEVIKHRLKARESISYDATWIDRPAWWGTHIEYGERARAG